MRPSQLICRFPRASYSRATNATSSSGRSFRPGFLWLRRSLNTCSTPPAESPASPSGRHREYFAKRIVRRKPPALGTEFPATQIPAGIRHETDDVAPTVLRQVSWGAVLSMNRMFMVRVQFIKEQEATKMPRLRRSKRLPSRWNDDLNQLRRQLIRQTERMFGLF